MAFLYHGIGVKIVACENAEYSGW